MLRRTAWSCVLGLSAGAGAAAAEPKRTLFSAGGHYLIVEALRDDLVHFETGLGAGDASHAVYTTPMVAKTDYTGPTSFAATAAGVETAGLRVNVDPATLCSAVYDKQRGVLLSTVCAGSLDQPWKTLAITSPGTQNVYGLGQYFTSESADGDWIGRVWDPLAGTYGATLRPFAGGNNDYSLFPIMYALGAGTESYALFVDQVYKQMWDFRAAPWHVGMWGDQMRWYVLAGEDLPALRRSYMELTGKPPVPPKRSFGLWVSQFGFGSWQELHSELASLRAGHFPIDGFAMDLQWFGGTFGDPDHSKMGSLTWDGQAFADYPAEILRLRDDEGVRLMPIEEPYISNLLPEYLALMRPGYLVRDCAGCGPAYLNYNPWWGRGGMVDYTSVAAGDFWHDYRRQLLTGLGITDHWADLGEPEQYLASAWYAGFPELGKHAHADVNNIYGSSWMASIDRGYRRHAAEDGNVRPYMLSRTGTSGIQRYGSGMWSGDIGSNWGNLRSQMNAQMHMSLSGVDYYGSDVGGFQPNRAGAEGGPELLYTQWFADSAATDVPLRPHAWNLDKGRPTAPSERGDAASNLANLRQRYELAPYYYSLAFAAHASGEPVVPPLVYYHQADAAARQIGDEKEIGRGLLVALAADAAAVTRNVYLPASGAARSDAGWAELRSGRWLPAAGQVNDVPLYERGVLRLPLYARAGAIIPMAVVDDQTMNIRGKRQGGVADETLRLRVFADEAATAFNLYEDDGETYAYEAGTYASTILSQQLVGSTASVSVGAVTGTYNGMPQSRPVVIDVSVSGMTGAGARVDGATLPLCGAKLDSCYAVTGSFTTVYLGVRPTGQVLHVEVQLQPAPPESASLYFACLGAQPDAGSSVYAVGDAPALGAWQLEQGVRLAPAPNGAWTGLITGLPAAAPVAWKCVQRADTGGAVVWQQGGNSTARTNVAGYGGLTSGHF